LSFHITLSDSVSRSFRLSSLTWAGTDASKNRFRIHYWIYFSNVFILTLIISFPSRFVNLPEFCIVAIGVAHVDVRAAVTATHRSEVYKDGKFEKFVLFEAFRFLVSFFHISMTLCKKTIS
jgi:hypothetical protein